MRRWSNQVRGRPPDASGRGWCEISKQEGGRSCIPLDYCGSKCFCIMHLQSRSQSALPQRRWSSSVAFHPHSLETHNEQVIRTKINFTSTPGGQTTARAATPTDTAATGTQTEVSAPCAMLKKNLFEVFYLFAASPVCCAPPPLRERVHA